jgi:soluble lytic murein transglycosylase-like protein
MVLELVILAATALSSSQTPTGGDFVSMARAGRWDRILEVAATRSSQLPLRPEDALVAAWAAGEVRDRTARVRFLELAADHPDLGSVARVELAEILVSDDPGRALDFVISMLKRAPTRELRRASVDVAVRAIETGLDPGRREIVERTIASMSRSTRRPIELALALTDEPINRERLSVLLAGSTRDLVALTAALELEAAGALGVVDQWRVAKTFYRHALYDRAAPMIEALDGVDHRQVPGWEVAYLRGRCAFRTGRWSDSMSWYRKAISRTSPGERRAQLEVHLARTYELAGEMDGAVAAAQRAVRIKTTDDRRLFLARLRLRRQEFDLAAAGLSRLRSRTARARGDLMVGLFELRWVGSNAALERLGAVTRDPWRGPAAVLAAELAATAGDADVAIELLVGAAPSLDAFWAGQARRVMAGLSDEEIHDWRRREDALLTDPVQRDRRRALARMLRLEFDPARLGRLRVMAAAELGLTGEPEQPAFSAGLATDLWAIGLEEAAVRWDPSGLPRDSARATWWTAQQELELGRPWLAISAADGAWRQATSRLPARGLPEGLRRALYPIPYRDELHRAASRYHVPWSLLAGVARAESRWNPNVLSRVGARGLMQLMPATAAETGAANGHANVTPGDLFEPTISLDLGAAELGRLLTVFGGNRAAAVAAYNAGQAQAQLWLDQCGDDCPEGRYVAHISFSVTRGYTEEVLAAMAAYAELEADVMAGATE